MAVQKELPFGLCGHLTDLLPCLVCYYYGILLSKGLKNVTTKENSLALQRVVNSGNHFYFLVANLLYSIMFGFFPSLGAIRSSFFLESMHVFRTFIA